MNRASETYETPSTTNISIKGVPQREQTEGRNKEIEAIFGETMANKRSFLIKYVNLHIPKLKNL